VVPDQRIDPLDTAGASQIVQPLNLTFRRVGVEGGPLHVIYQIVDEDSGVRQRVGTTAGPQVEWRSDETGRNIGASRNESYALLRSGEVMLDARETSEQASLRLFLTNLREDLAAGIYREQFTVRFWCSANGDALPYESPGIVSVTVQVPNVLSANIAGASTHGEIDFLDFSTLSRSLSVSVRSTGPYSVSARSLNGGVLLREGGSSAQTLDRIPYSASFDGRPLPLDSGASFKSERAGLEGRQISLEVVAEDASSKRAGEYRDTLVLTLAPVA